MEKVDCRTTDVREKGEKREFVDESEENGVDVYGFVGKCVYVYTCGVKSS